MAATTDDDPEAMPDAELLALLEVPSPAGGLTPEEKQQRLSGYEQEFQDQLEARAWQAPAGFGSADCMADLGDEYTCQPSRLSHAPRQRLTINPPMSATAPKPPPQT